MPLEHGSFDVTGGLAGVGTGYEMEGSATASEGPVGRRRAAEGKGPSRARWRGPASSFRYRAVKRALDLLLILLFSPILLVVFALVAIAVRANSPGDVFFSHRRIGHRQKFFSMWKFRTMCKDSDEVLETYLSANPEARHEWLQTHKLRSDPRVTKIGAWLRRSSLDELPQIWNVVNGSMSLVGPRPIVSAEVEKYGESFADYCAVKPGITGLWQISGRSATTYVERIQLDRQYARTWTLRRDVSILLKTLRSVIKQEGAY